MNRQGSMTARDISQVLTTVVVDQFEFQATWSASYGQGCILWIRDSRNKVDFEPLGRFSHFEKRQVLEFVTRYVTNPDLREEISKKRFQLHLETLSPRVLAEIDSLSFEEKRIAFRGLFNLDSVVDQFADLGWKRRLMAKKFHPDKGGSTQSMTVINEGYEYLSEYIMNKKK